ncbi:MAG TPA: 1,4-beta-xylanase [Bacteroidales bacterium]|nr:1,4-beta-xylanase [Bacteroidales bacterium]
MKFRKLSFFLLWLFVFSACGDTDEPADEPVVERRRPRNLAEYNLTTDGLRHYFANAGYFDVGVAVEPRDLDNPTSVALIRRHFNAIVAENAMKWDALQPSEGNFRWTNADRIVNFAEANNMRVRGHTLIWHNQTPAWVFQQGNGQPVSREVLLQRLRNHVTAVVSRYRGRVYAWDVVNEAIDNGGATYRGSQWFNILGEDFIFEAFRAARAADPAAKLFYNDYRETDPIKREKIFTLLSRLRAEGLVDGMGMQGHWNVDWPSNDDLIDAINRYASLGLEIHITELDVSIYTSQGAPMQAFTPEVAMRQRAAYTRFFGVFRRHKDRITNVTFWGVHDGNSWLNNWPVQGRADHPLLFDRNHNPKEAYFGVIDF